MVNNYPFQVKCNTCDSEHKMLWFPTNQSGKSQLMSAGSAKSPDSIQGNKAPEINYKYYKARLKDCDLSRVRRYSMNGSYKEDEIIEHYKFGIGIVLSLIHNNIKVLFMDGPRILIHEGEVVGNNSIVKTACRTMQTS